MGLVLAAVNGLILFLPAMAPNSVAVLTGGGTPVDFGRSWRGRRVLGDGKTWRGLFGGVAGAMAMGLIIWSLIELSGSPLLGYGRWPDGLGVIFTLSLGALLGDMAGAFIKRRLGMERGQKAPVLDQYDFVIGAMALTAAFHAAWFKTAYVVGDAIAALLLLLVLIPLAHRGVNIIGFKMGKKKEPW